MLYRNPLKGSTFWDPPGGLGRGERPKYRSPSMRSGPEAAKDCPSGCASDQVGATTQAAYVVSWNMNMCVYIHEYIHEYI